NTSGVVPIQTEHASTTIHGINVKINDSPEKMCGITRCPARLCALGNRISLEGTPRRVGGHSPTRLGVPFKLIRFYYTQRRAGHPRSSPRRFAAYNEAGHPRSCPSPLRGNFFSCRCVVNRMSLGCDFVLVDVLVLGRYNFALSFFVLFVFIF
ncbi:MAG: hypothetical protein LBQ66_16130, partial [Planctomycetaceae bacterium]|nr:hypothetical protein [Planctomycetaceae bacterium]